MSEKQHNHSKFFSKIQDNKQSYLNFGNLEKYDEERNGPLLGISDEGSAVETIIDAAYNSAKAKAHKNSDAKTIGIIVDGERMTSAGEVPIGPEEYETIVGTSNGRTYCTTNVGVRANARLYQPLPEFRVALANENEEEWIKSIFSTFEPFIKTPDGTPRPLIIRLLIVANDNLTLLSNLLSKLENGRQNGKIGSPELHRITILIDFKDKIVDRKQLNFIKEIVDFASLQKIPEVAIDGDLVEASRRRLGVQGLLNILNPDDVKEMLAFANIKKVKLTYRYNVDSESATRTVWTGLFTARANGLNAAKYGMVPLSFEEQSHLVTNIHRWMKDWTAIPAFYVDTPLLTNQDVFLTNRCEEALKKWIDMVSNAGAKVALVDCPDRITPRIDEIGKQTPRRLIKTDPSNDNDRGVLSLDQISNLISYSKNKNLKILWSGGIRPELAYKLGQLGVFGIFTTSSTATPIPVGDVLAGDWQLSYENEPTKEGVRRVHTLLQAGFLYKQLLKKDEKLVNEIEELSSILIDSSITSESFNFALSKLNNVLIQGWKFYWNK